MNNVKTFCAKTTETTKKIMSKTKEYAVSTGNKIIDRLTPKRDYSDLPEEDAAAMRKMDRDETASNICWWSFYIIYYFALIAYCVKKSKEVKMISAEK